MLAKLLTRQSLTFTQRRLRLYWSLFGLVLGAVVSLAFIPTTAWIVRKQVRYFSPKDAFVPLRERGEKLRSQAVAVAEESRDFALKIASLSLMEPRVALFTSDLLANKTPQSAFAQAAYLNRALESAASESRALTFSYETADTETFSFSSESPLLKRIREVALRGEVLEPDNPYFSYCYARSFLHGADRLSAWEFDQAMQGFARAAKKPYWKDYLSLECAALLRLGEKVLGPLSAETRMLLIELPRAGAGSLSSNVALSLSTHLSNIDKTKEQRLVSALRGNMLRVATKIYLQSDNFLYANQARELATLAVQNASPIPPNVRGTLPVLLTAYTKKLFQRGFTQEAAWTEKVTEIFAPAGDSFSPTRLPRLQWMVGQLLLGAIGVAGLGALLCTLWYQRYRYTPQEKGVLSTTEIVGTGLGFLAFVVAICLSTAPYFLFTEDFVRRYLLFSLVITAIAGTIGFRKRGAWTALGVYGGISLLGLAALYCGNSVRCAIFEMFGFLYPRVESIEEDQTLIWECFVGVCVPLLLIVFGMLLRSKMKGKPVVSEALRTFASLTPFVTLLLVGYGAFVINIALEENTASVAVQRYATQNRVLPEIKTMPISQNLVAPKQQSLIPPK